MNSQALPLPEQSPSPSADGGTAPAPSPLLERVGVRYFRRRSTAVPKVEAADAVHYLNPEERAALRWVQRGAIIRACLAGALSTAVAATVEALAQPLLGPDPDAATWEQSARFWAVVGGATVLAAVLEISFLYWDSLRSVHELARVAGLDLFPERDEAGERKAVASALARAALELPNPAHRVFGVNPRREASRWQLLFATLAYKLKVSVSNFLLKAVVRRILGRSAVRAAVVPFVAVPVTAAWNGVVSYLVMREARLRAMGPSAVKELVGIILGEAPTLTPAGRLAAIRAVASAIVRTRDLHPNLMSLLKEVVARCAPAAAGEVDDVGEFLRSLAQLKTPERQVALRLLHVATI
ncbi:MAG: hypothetical protein HYZ28_25010, partial [Myxococcales bacterium]|nr:hypothetical protein [Myxococcales bacterium]